jgi:DNA-binding NarL/FixJ family response regulator
MQPLHVAVYATDPITHAGIASVLQPVSGITVLAESQLTDADVFLVAARVVTADIMTVLRSATQHAKLRTVLVTDHLPDTDLLTAVECGVVAILPRAAATSQRLSHALTAAASGRAIMPPAQLGTLLAQVERLQRDVLAPHGLNASGLAPREVDVLRLMADGLDTLEIATQLNYSERTVKNIMYALMNRLGLRNRPHAVAYALRAGVL